jgi:hypothetical protein
MSIRTAHGAGLMSVTPQGGTLPRVAPYNLCKNHGAVIMGLTYPELSSVCTWVYTLSLVLHFERVITAPLLSFCFNITYLQIACVE